MKDVSLDLDRLMADLTGMSWQDPPIAVPWLGHTGYRDHSRRVGLDWPQTAVCMIGLVRLANVRDCVERVLRDNIPGDLLEAGVWRGGTTIFMRAILKAYGVVDRAVWVADSFVGLPTTSPRFPNYWPQADALAVPQAEVRANFERYGLLDDQVRFLAGWFSDSLPNAPVEKLALLRMDGDLYESQMDAFTYLYPKLSPGGIVIVDDPQLVCCQQAISDYRARERITEPIQTTEDGFAIFWRKAKLP